MREFNEDVRKDGSPCPWDYFHAKLQEDANGRASTQCVQFGRLPRKSGEWDLRLFYDRGEDESDVDYLLRVSVSNGSRFIRHVNVLFRCGVGVPFPFYQGVLYRVSCVTRGRQDEFIRFRHGLPVGINSGPVNASTFFRGVDAGREFSRCVFRRSHRSFLSEAKLQSDFLLGGVSFIIPSFGDGVGS